MARFVRDGDTLLLELSTGEKLEAAHDDIRVPVTAVVSAKTVDDPFLAVGSFKVTGSLVPGMLAVGSFRSDDGTIFAAVHRHTPRALKVVLRDGPFDVLLVGVEDPETALAQLGLSGALPVPPPDRATGGAMSP